MCVRHFSLLGEIGKEYPPSDANDLADLVGCLAGVVIKSSLASLNFMMSVRGRPPVLPRALPMPGRVGLPYAKWPDAKRGRCARLTEHQGRVSSRRALENGQLS